MNTVTRQLGLCLAICVLAASCASAQLKPVLRISYDNGFDGVGIKGTVVGTAVGKPELVPGRSGLVMKTGETTGYIEYPTEGILSRLGGTVEMWVSPLDWKHDDKVTHFFFDASGKGSVSLAAYPAANPDYERNLQVTASNGISGDQPAWITLPVKDWAQDQWHHIAATWSDTSGVMCYVDGKPAGASPVLVSGSMPEALGKIFSIGDHYGKPGEASSVLVDDVRIYSRALSPADIAAHAAGNYDFITKLDPNAVTLDYDIDARTNQAVIRLDINGADVDEASLKAGFAVVPKGAAFPDQSLDLAFAAGQTQTTLPLPYKNPGQYDVVAHIQNDGAPTIEKRTDLIIPATPWLGSKLGMEDKVLPPWTPMKVAKSKSGTTIKCWGRSYSFGKGAFLATQIESAGASLLSRPVSLVMKSGGRTVPLKAQQARVLSASDTRVELSGNAIAEIGEMPCAFSARVTTEYDGLALFEISAKDLDKAALDDVTIDIPIKAEHALYRHRYMPTWVGKSGNVPEGTGVVDKAPFSPLVWLGDNDRGLFWFCESDEMWPNGGSDNAIEIVRSANEIVLRLHLLSKGQKLPANWKFVFGLQATPVKAVPKDWRKWRLDYNGSRYRVTKANAKVPWPEAILKDSYSFGWPRPNDPAAWTEYVKGLHAKGLKVIPYLCLAWVDDGTPEYKYFHKLWDQGPFDPIASAQGYKSRFVQTSPLGKGFSDFLTTSMKDFLDRYEIDGEYHDMTLPWSSSKLDTGVGYVRDGKAYPTFPILAYRALYRRNYAVLKSLPRETLSMSHMSGTVTVPMLAYEDAYLDGEHLRDAGLKGDYLDLITLDTFRCEYMGRQFGLMPFFLPEFRGEYAEQVEPTRGMMALLMIHDVSPYSLWCNVDVVNEAFKGLDEFGYVDSDFIPYFDPTPPATTDMNDVYVSAYKRKDGRALLVVGNMSKEDRQGTVSINAKRLALPLIHVVSWPDKENIPATGNTVQLQVPGRGYRMLVVEQK